MYLVRSCFCGCVPLEDSFSCYFRSCFCGCFIRYTSCLIMLCVLLTIRCLCPIPGWEEAAGDRSRIYVFLMLRLSILMCSSYYFGLGGGRGPLANNSLHHLHSEKLYMSSASGFSPSYEYVDGSVPVLKGRRLTMSQRLALGLDRGKKKRVPYRMVCMYHIPLGRISNLDFSTTKRVPINIERCVLGKLSARCFLRRRF